MRMQRDKPGTMVDAVEAKLEHAIMNGFFAAGSALPGEARLARELSVSRPTLRNALSRLISRGLLEPSQGRQTRVSPLGRFTTPLHRLFEQLPAAFAEARAPDAIERRLLRTAELIESGNILQLHRYTLEALEVEDLASMAALTASPEARR